MLATIFKLFVAAVMAATIALVFKEAAGVLGTETTLAIAVIALLMRRRRR